MPRSKYLQMRGSLKRGQKQKRDLGSCDKLTKNFNKLIGAIIFLTTNNNTTNTFQFFKFFFKY